MIDNPAAAPILLDRRGIGGLLEELRKNRFDVGTSEAIDATQLIVTLAQREPEGLDPNRLCARLRPIFCKSRDQQERFDEIFLQWLDTQPKETGVGIGEGRDSAPLKQPVQPKRRWPWFAALAVLALGTAWWAVERRRQPPARTLALAPVTQPAVTTTSGRNTTTNPPPAQTEEARELGYFPRLRYNVELRPAWAWLLIAPPLLALFGFSLPALVIARTRARRRSDPMYLDRRDLEREARRIVPPLRPEIVSRLARHVRMRPNDDALRTRRPVLDFRGTVERTLRNRGIPTPHFRATQAHPSYLLLVDVANQKDPRGRMFYQWAERLRRERLDVEIAVVRLRDGQPQFVEAGSAGEPADERNWRSMARLPRPPFGQRLLLISTGEPLVDATGVWRSEAVAARLHRWRERALFTPIEPRDWGQREESIERSEHTSDPGFLVLPLDENALSAWTDLLNTGHLSNIVLSEPQRYPALLRRGKSNSYIDDVAPSPDRIEKLIGQLRVYLGEYGFTWLAALAIPPLVRWELALLLGRDLLGMLTDDLRDVDGLLARNYHRMARLPWLRMERMPDWLRFRLLAELPKKMQEDVRRIAESLLGSLALSPGKEGIELEFERPPGERGTITLSRDARVGDPIYLGYMSGLTPQQLAMRAPETWGKWLGKMRIHRAPGLRGWFARSTDQAKAWWARRMFLGGMPLSGIRKGSFLWSSAFAVLAFGMLTVAAVEPTDQWPQWIQDHVFSEKAHTIALDHAGLVSYATLSHDGRWVLTASDGTARVWDAATGAPVSSVMRHQGRIRNAEFSANDKYVLTASDDQTARVWNARTGKALGPPLEHRGTIEYATFSPDGLRIFTAETLQPATIWDPRTGNHVSANRFSSPLNGRVEYAEFAPNGRAVLMTTRSAGYVWDLDQNAVLPVGGRVVSRPAFAPNSTNIAVVEGREMIVRPVTGKLKPLTAFATAQEIDFAQFGEDSETRLVKLSSPDTWLLFVRDRVFTLSIGQGVTNAHLSPDGHRLITVSADNAVRVWSWRMAPNPSELRELASTQFGLTDLSGSAQGFTTETIGAPLRHRTAVTHVEISHDLARVLTVSDRSVRLWDAAGAVPAVVPLRHKNFVTNVSFSRDGSRILTGSDDGSVVVWNATSGASLSPPMTHKGHIWSAVFSPDGGRVATSSSDFTARVWNAKNGQPVTPSLNHRGYVYDVRFRADGSRVVTASADKTAAIWDARTGRRLQVLQGHGAGVFTAAFSPDSRLVVTSSMDGTAAVWDAQTSNLQHTLWGKAPVVDAQFTSDSRSVIMLADNSTVMVWDAKTGTLTTAMTAPGLGNGENALNATLSPDGRWVATTGSYVVQLWNPRSGKAGPTLRHNARTRSAAFSPDSRLIATASDEGTVRVWDTSTGEMIHAPLLHADEVNVVAFNPDGTRIASGSGGHRRGALVLPEAYHAPMNSVQIWHAPLSSTPPASPAEQVRRATERAATLVRTDPLAWLFGPVGVSLAVALLASWRHGRQVRRLAEARLKMERW